MLSTAKEIKVRSDAGFFTPPKPEKWVFVLGLLLLVATVSLYYPVKNHPFVNYDDDDYVTGNLNVQSGLNWDTLRWAFTTYDKANWHPLTWLSHALDYQLFQLDPAGHHIMNLLLHVVNVLLLFWVLQQATGYPGRSAVVAAMFALHPMNVESVAWIAERKTLLSMLFFLLALGFYRWYAREPKFARYAVVAFLYALGLMAKPQVITLPCVLLLWDYWPLRRMFADDAKPSTATAGSVAFPGRSFSWLVMEKIPLFAIAMASATITMQAQRMGGARISIPRLIRLENAIVSYARYVGKAFCPSRLALFYPYSGNSLKAWEVLAAVAFLLAVTALVLVCRRRRYLLVGWFWFVGTLVPMIGLIQVGMQAMADRYAYLPFIGLFIMGCWAVADWAEQWHLPTAAAAGVGIGGLVALTTVAYHQLNYWQSNISLWSHTIQVTSDNSVAETSLGSALLEAGRFDDSVKHFRAALAISPLDPIANLDLGFCEQKQQHLRAAIEQYQKVINMPAPRALKAKAFENIGYAYADLGDSVEAQESFAEAAKLSGRPQ